MREIITLKWEKGNLLLLDQTLLPHTVTYATCKSPGGRLSGDPDYDCQRRLAIGVSAGYGMVLAAGAFEERHRLIFGLPEGSRERIFKIFPVPTAVNLNVGRGQNGREGRSPGFSGSRSRL